MSRSSPELRVRALRALRALRGLLAFLVAFVTAATTYAEERSPARERQLARCAQETPGDLTCLGDDALADDGWQFDRVDIAPGSIAAGFAATTAGWAWTGVGHFIIGDDLTARRLLIAQLVAALAIGAGWALDATTDGVASDISADLLRVGGGSLLAGAWAADIVGSFRGLGTGLGTNTAREEGLAFEVFYTILLGRGVAEPGVGVVRLPWVSRYLRVRPRAEVDVSLDYRILGADGALRLPLGQRGSVLELIVDGEDAWWRDDGAGWTRAGGGISATLDVGDVFPHLSGLWWTTAVSGQAEWPRLRSSGASRFRESIVWTVPIDMWLSLNLSRSVNLLGGYRHRRDQLVGALTPRLGMFFAQVSVTPRDRLGIELALEMGDSVRAWAGLRFNLISGRRERNGSNGP